MFVATIGDQIVRCGMQLSFEDIEDTDFKVKEILSNGLRVEWESGDQKGQESVLPLHIFGEILKISEIIDETEPNQAFSLRKHL